MATSMKYGITKRFGARYGRTMKERVGKADLARKNAKNCPYCLKDKVDRIAAGIWFCKKCNFKFTGGAYTQKAKVVVVEAAE